MRKTPLNIAIFSPNEKSYSETFIQAHKTLLPGKIFFYYGHNQHSIRLENSKEDLINLTFSQRLRKKLSKSYKKRSKWVLLKNSLLKNNIDVILVEYGNHAFTFSSLFKEMKIPFVVHFHGYDASVTTELERCYYYKDIFKECAGVIVVSQYMKNTLLEMGCPEDKMYYNTYGPNDLFFKVRATYEKNQLVGIGRFVNKKAPYFTVLAFAKVLEIMPDARLIIGGDGPLLGTCINLAEYLEIDHAVSFPGPITPKQFKNYLSESRAFVQHSVVGPDGDMEGTPVAIMEAQAAGLPVIATLHAGIPDVVLHEETGILVKEKDVNAMAEGMLLLLGDKNRAETFGRNGRIRIHEHFTIEKHIKSLYEILVAAVVI